MGLFIGCGAVSFCPKRLLRAQDPDTRHDTSEPSGPAAGPADPPFEYRSAFKNWDERAALRSAPRRLVPADPQGRYFFSPDQVPVAGHPLVKALPEPHFRSLLTQHLYRYLDFTAKLESLVVNRTVLGIAQGSVDIDVPEQMRFDAYRIYCDEAYHTLFSADLARQVEAVSGLAPRLPATPRFLLRLAQLQQSVDPHDRPLMEMLFVVISETLISGTLAEVPERDDVIPAVRQTVSDHASDEGRHHAYFAAFLRLLWAHLDSGQRVRAACWVPVLMDVFLTPDYSTIRAELGSYGMAEDDIETVLADVFAAGKIDRQRSAVARLTTRYFEELGVFEPPRVRELMHEYGFAVVHHHHQ